MRSSFEFRLHEVRHPMNGNNRGTIRYPHSEQHGYVPPGPVYFQTNDHGQLAPPGYAFNQDGVLVQLPYEPWSEGPQMAWEDPNNPVYLEYAQGRMTNEQHPQADPTPPTRYGKHTSIGHVAPVTHEDVTLVPQSAYLERDGDIIPQQDEGTGSPIIFDMPASPARTRYRLSKEVTGYVEVEAPLAGTNSPLLVVPVGSAEIVPPAISPVALFGGAVVLGNFQFGHLGGQIANIIADVLPGTVVKVPTVSSFMRITARMAPRYFAHVDAGVVPNITRTYLLFPGGPPLTNDSFSDLPPNIMELQGSGPGTIVAAGAQGVPVSTFGWCALGFSTTPSIDSLPTRIFNGSVLSAGPAPAAPFTNIASIPIPHGALSVRVIGGFFNPLDTPQAVPIEWFQVLDWGAVEGPFQADTEEPIPLLPGAVSILVSGGNSKGAGAIEVPFSAFFYLNV